MTNEDNPQIESSPLCTSVTRDGMPERRPLVVVMVERNRLLEEFLPRYAPLAADGVEVRPVVIGADSSGLWCRWGVVKRLSCLMCG